jgi:hypothetical protein
MKKLNKLTIKKVTLQDLNKPSLDAVAGGGIYTTQHSCFGTCVATVCGTCIKCT